MTFLSFSWLFGLLAVLRGFWIRISNFVLFVINGLIKGEIEKPCGQYLGLICDESLTCHGLNLNSGNFRCFMFIFVSCGESRLLVMWYVGDRCDMVGCDEDHRRSRRPDAEDRRWSDTCRVLGDWAIERLGDVVYHLHHELGDEECGIQPQNHGLRFVSGLTSKPLGWFVGGLASKPLGQYLPVWPQNRW
jgi:hypothetical protein